VLNVQVHHSVTRDGVGALAKLEHLQQFLFVEEHHVFQNSSTRVMQVCALLLPGLLFSGKMIKIRQTLTAEYGELDETGGDQFYGLPHSWPWPSALALRQLRLTCPTRMPVGVVLPNLETLHVIEPRQKFSLLGLLSLTELALERVLRREQLEQLLSSVGHQLTTLAVSTLDTLFVDRVLSMCPILQQFFIPTMPLDFIGVDEPLLMEDHQCLVEWGFTFRPDEDQFESRFRPDHLLQILRAVPNLRVWRITDYWFEEDDSALLCEALAQKSILRNLAEFYVTHASHTLENIIQSDFEEVPLSIQVATDKVLHCLIDHCPTLLTVKLIENCGYPWYDQR
jgi:hypothetical protein